MKNLKILLVGLLLILALVAFAQEMPVDENGMPIGRMITKQLCGLADYTGAEIIPCEYENSVFILNDMVYGVTPNDKIYIMNLKGERLSNVEYDFPPIFINGYSLIFDVNREKLGCVDIQGNTVVPLEYGFYRDLFNEFICLRKGFLIVIKDGKYGVIDLKNQIIVPFEYEKIDISKNYYQKKDNVLRVKKDGKIGYITTKGEELVIPKYDDGNFYTNGLATVKIGDKYTVLDIRGKELFAPVGGYDLMYAVNSKFIIVMKEGKIGFVNIEGKEVSPCEFTLFKTNSIEYKFFKKKYKDPKEAAKSLAEYAVANIEKDFSPLIRFYKDNKPCFVNQNGEIAFSPDVYDAEKFVDNRSIFTIIDGFEVNMSLLYGKRTEGVRFNNIKDAYEYVKNIPQKDIDSMVERNKGRGFDWLWNSQEHFFVSSVTAGNLHENDLGIIDSVPMENNLYGKSPEDSMTVFNKEFGLDIPFGPDTEKYSLIEIITKKGVFVPNGSVIIPPNYDDISPFEDGVAIFIQNYKSGLITKDNKIIPTNYYWVDVFSNGMAYVRKKMEDGSCKYGYIDKNGKEVIPCMYDITEKFIGNKAIVGIFDKKNDGKNDWKNMRYGVIDSNNNMLVDCKYKEGEIEITKGGAILCSSKEGRSIIYNGAVSSPWYSDIRESDSSFFNDKEHELIFGVPKPVYKYLNVAYYSYSN